MEKKTYGTAGQFFDSALYGANVYEFAGTADDFGENIREITSGETSAVREPFPDMSKISEPAVFPDAKVDSADENGGQNDLTDLYPEKYEHGKSILLRNRQTGEMFFVRRTDVPQKYRLAYFHRVLEAPRMNGILWPVDIVTLPEPVLQKCTLFVDRQYVPFERPRIPSHTSDKPLNSCALAFPLPPFPSMSAPQLLRALEQEPFSLRPAPLVDIRGWKNPNIRLFAVHLTRVLMLLNENGYLYNEFDLARIRMHRDFSIYGICPPEKAALFLDYSNFSCSFGGRLSGDDAFLNKPRGNYPLTFGDCAVLNRIIKKLDIQSQNYSLCAFLFWLFFRRHPYDGALVSGYPDDSPWNHEIKFRACHRAPVFIFDPDDTSNRIGAFDDDQETLTLWNASPQELREPFIRTLSEANALRKTPPDNPGPEDWLKLFRKLQWNMDVTL